MDSAKISIPPEGRRERKRRETRARIAEAAMTLFRERGFTAVTVDEIAERADVSKPTFFNYFPAKEDVVLAWQDRFAEAVAQAVVARPAAETMIEAVEAAMLETLADSATSEAFALDDLIQSTPALAARNQAKYLHLEAALADALTMRAPEADPLSVRMLAMVTTGALRVGAEAWRSRASSAKSDLLPYSREVMETLWEAIGGLVRDRVPPRS